MPAAAVIPAPIAYIKVAAVKKLVVGSACRTVGAPLVVVTASCDVIACRFCRDALHLGALAVARCTFTLNKLECSKQAFRLNIVCME